MNEGDPVVVENLDGEKTEGELVAKTGKRSDEVTFPRGSEGKQTTIAAYWWGKVEPAEEVYRVRLGEKVYSYPASKVSEVDE